MGRTMGVVRQRCPRCLQGRVFGGFLTMNESCPRCGYVFGREEGYFTGAMYVSYFLGLILVFGLIAIVWPMWPSHTLAAIGALFGVVTPLYLVMVPAVFRYSRVAWLHLDYVVSVRRESDRPD